MSVSETPRQFKFTCDSCGATVSQETMTRPKFWSTLFLEIDHYDSQGPAVANGTIKRDLCYTCSGVVVDIINKATS